MNELMCAVLYVVFGATQGAEGYPRELSSKVIERLQELSFEGVKIILSHGLIQLPGTDTKEELQRASYNVNKEQISREITHKGNPDLELMMKHQDIVSNYRQIYYNSAANFSKLLHYRYQGSRGRGIQSRKSYHFNPEI